MIVFAKLGRCDLVVLLKGTAEGFDIVKARLLCYLYDRNILLKQAGCFVKFAVEKILIGSGVNILPEHADKVFLTVSELLAQFENT